MRALVPVLALAICLPGPAFSQADGAAKPAKARKVCRADTKTGSRMARASICMTQDEWDRYDAATAANARGFIDHVSGVSSLVPTVELMDAEQRARQMPDPRSSPGY